MEHSVMMKYEVGKPFPNPRFNVGIEGCFASFNTAFFDVVGVLSSLTRQEKRTWKTGKIRYGFWVHDTVPFFLIDFGDGFNFDCSFNIFKIEQDKMNAWLFGQGNTITLFLIEQNNYTLQAMRLISVDQEKALNLRFELNKQRVKYISSAEVDQKIQQIYSQVSTHQMIQQCQMKALGGNPL